MAPTTAALVCQRIEQAFGAVPYPGDANLTTNPQRNAPFPDDVADAFRGTSWQTVTTELVRRFCDDLPFMTPAAFHYYVPAYMTRCVLAPADVNTACTSVIVLLTPPNPKKASSWKWWWERAKLMDHEQTQAIAEFLAYEDAFEREEWASMGKQLTKTGATKALGWWKKRAARGPIEGG